MELWTKTRSLFRNLFRKPEVESDLHAEIHAYVEMVTEEKIAAGMPYEEARQAALAEMGGAERLKQSVREQRVGRGIESLLQDLRYGVRQLRKSPGFGVTVIATLALTIGITTAIFSVLYAMLIRPLPYHDVERIVVLDTHTSHGAFQAASYPEYADWRKMSHSFSALAAFEPWGNVNLESSAGPVGLPIVRTTDNYFDIFQVRPILGRTFLFGEDQDGRNDVIVLSYEVWQQYFGAAKSIVDQQVKLDGRAYTVIGVMPAGFRFPINRVNAVYTPLHMTSEKHEDRGFHWLQTIGRLKPGVTPKAAEADLMSVFIDLGRFDIFNKGRRVNLIDLDSYIVGKTDSSLRLLLYAVLILLSIGCVNIAGLLLARGVKRGREIALRSAIGANRSRIIRQILTEGLLYAFWGAVGGIVMAFGLLRTIRLLLIAALARGAEVELNIPVLLAALITAAGVTVLAALIPAFRLSGTAPNLALKSGGSTGTTRGQNRLRAAFVITQVALALTLVVVSGLLMRMLGGLRGTELGFSPDHILTTEVDLSTGHYEGRDVLADFYQPLFEKIHAIPGVQAVGMIQMLPIQAWGWNWEHIHIVGTPPLVEPRTPSAEIRFVSQDYFRVFQNELVSGRLLDPSLDRPKTRFVAVVNEAFVRKFIPPGRDPIGVQIGDDSQKNVNADQPDPRVTIIGVVKNIRQNIYAAPAPEIDYLVTQIREQDSLQVLSTMHLIVRTNGDPETIIPSLQRAFHDVDPTLPFRAPETMRSVVAEVLILERLENWLFGTFAALAVLLAVVGLYGLISHEVELSTRDFGVRLALGAKRGKILSDIYRRVAWMLGIGAFIGLLLTASAKRYINSVVAIDMEKDVWRVLGLTLVLIAAGMLAAFFPAQRASSIDPMHALREE